jgi:hypothetical protein
MATLSMRGSILVALAAGGLTGCGPSVGTVGAGPVEGPVEQGTSYPGKGFIVHEWGTDTVVVGSDGSLQRGLHHEEEDLPGFVYDRLKAGALVGSGSVEVKMETPVTYFYTDTPRAVNVTVGFPKGVLTQWYPLTYAFAPAIVGPMSAPQLMLDHFADPVLDPAFPFGSSACVQAYSGIADGFLDWGTVDVLARGQAPAVPDAPLDQYTWSYARQVDANPVHVGGMLGAVPDQYEKFLFYRGLGRFDLPVVVTSQAGGRVSLFNGYGEGIGRVVVINVNGGQGTFTVLDRGVAAGATVTAGVPDPGETPVASLVDGLARELTADLDATGLYHDEAVAMVNTWKRQWFTTPGVRLLYLIPQSWTDASIPLTVMPAPDATVRVMMIRVEVITPELEQADVAAAQGLASPATQAGAQAYFLALGRFAEPRLRRALSLLGQPAYAEPFLASIATVDTLQAAGE